MSQDMNEERCHALKTKHAVQSTVATRRSVTSRFASVLPFVDALSATAMATWARQDHAVVYSSFLHTSHTPLPPR